MIDVDPFALGARVKARREELRMTQEELARQAGLSVASVSKLERGESSNPRSMTLRKYAAALKTTPEYLLHGERPPAPSPPAGDDAPEIEVALRATGDIPEEDIPVILGVVEAVRRKARLARLARMTREERLEVWDTLTDEEQWIYRADKEGE